MLHAIVCAFFPLHFVTTDVVFEPEHSPEFQCGKHLGKLWTGLCVGQVLCRCSGGNQTCWTSTSEGQTRLDKDMAILHHHGFDNLSVVNPYW